MVLARSLIFIFAALAHASKHELIVANFLNGFLYTVDFDDETLTLDLAANITVPVPSSWISFSHDKKNLYGTNYSYINDQENLAIPPTYVSYTVTNSTSITHDKTLAGHNNCNGSAIYIAAKPTEPYSVYGFDYWGTPGCGTVMSVDENGVLSEVIQDFEYLPDSGVHGSAFNKDSTLLYAADTLGNKIWTQPIDQDTGKLGDAIDILEGPSDHAEPRHVSLHQSGKALYAVMEGSNEVGWYSIDHCTGKPHFEETYPLLPSNFTDDNHWANEVTVSPSGKYAWATTRGRTDHKGFISVFELDENDGSIVKQNFLRETTSSGGVANVVTPAETDDRFVALTDNWLGFLEIWELAEDGMWTEPVARIDLADQGSDRYQSGCCSNAVWLS